MTHEPIDQLATLAADALIDQYSNHVLLKWPDEARAHQRGMNVGKPVAKVIPKRRSVLLVTPKHERMPEKKRGPKQTIPQSVIEGIRGQTGPIARVAKMFGVSPDTVKKVRNGGYDK